MSEAIERKFERQNFTRHNGYLSYNDDLIARFKYNSATNTPPFISFLIKNFTQEEYKRLYEKGLAPLQILMTKGYESPAIKAQRRAKESMLALSA